jgi:hypothetical protein
MEGYRNLQRPSIQVGIDHFKMAHQDQTGEGCNELYSQNGQMLNMNGHGVEQAGQHMFYAPSTTEDIMSTHAKILRTFIDDPTIQRS